MPRPTVVLRALAAPAAAALVAGCGGHAGVHGTFTSCATIGRPVAIADPARDQLGRLAGTSPEPQGDLLAVQVARGHGRLCLELRTRGKVQPAVAYVLGLRPPAADRPLVQLEVSVLAAANPEVLLNTGDGDAFRKIRGTVGIRGDRLSLVVDRSQFQLQGVGARFDAFRFQVRSAAVTQDGGHVTDCAPSCR